ncbi:hypothetical protein WJX82_000214 [Trebouxia sp. C0006]
MGVTATKQLSLSRLPSVLVIQLVRFDALGNKNETPIRVPPTLDIAAHCSKEALPSKPTYELVAVANHMGSRGSGHCTADCRVEKSFCVWPFSKKAYVKMFHFRRGQCLQLFV